MTETKNARLNLRVYGQTKKTLEQLQLIKAKELGVNLTQSQLVELLIEQEAKRYERKQVSVFD